MPNETVSVKNPKPLKKVKRSKKDWNSLTVADKHNLTLLHWSLKSMGLSHLTPKDICFSLSLFDKLLQVEVVKNCISETCTVGQIADEETGMVNPIVLIKPIKNTPPPPQETPSIIVTSQMPPLPRVS